MGKPKKVDANANGFHHCVPECFVYWQLSQLRSQCPDRLQRLATSLLYEQLLQSLNITYPVDRISLEEIFISSSLMMSTVSYRIVSGSTSHLNQLKMLLTNTCTCSRLVFTESELLLTVLES